MNSTHRFMTLSAILLATMSGCIGDGEDSSSDAGAMMHTGALLPWKVGNSWTYRVTDNDGITTKTTTIGELGPVGLGPLEDTMAYKVITKKSNGQDQTISWQAPVGDAVVRYREQSYDASSGKLELEEYWEPYKLHIDGSAEHTQAGAGWPLEYQETKVDVKDGVLGVPSTERTNDVWKVSNAASDRVGVTVPAGAYEDPIVIQKAGGSSLKTYWYVRGIGKVKESGGQTEELVSFTVAP